MKSICFFSSYYNRENIPGYVKFYLSELIRHFSEVIFLTTEKAMLPDDLKFLHSKNISYRLYKNEGFDFGMWYKAFLEFDMKNYDRVALVNDSCILFNKLDFYFDWLNKQEIDYSGLTDCNLMSYHVQSYFIVINKRAISDTLQYFKSNGIITNIKGVIKIFEVGLTTYLVKSDMNVKVFFSFKDFSIIGDPSWMQAKNLIKRGFPLVKKKIIIREYGDADWKGLILNGFDPVPSHYIRLIGKITGNPEYFDSIFEEFTPKMRLLDKWKFNFEYSKLRIHYFLRITRKSLRKLQGPFYRI